MEGERQNYQKTSGYMLYISVTVTISYLFRISKVSSCGEVRLVEDTGMVPLQIRIKYIKYYNTYIF